MKKRLKKLLLRLNKSFSISDKPVGESLTGFFGVSIVALPGVESGILESAGETKSNGPWVRAVFGDFGEIVCGLFNGLTAGEEDDASEVGGDVFLKDFGGGLADFSWSGLFIVLFTSKNHIDFEDAGA